MRAREEIYTPEQLEEAKKIHESSKKRFTNFTFPTIRKTFPSLVASEIFSVQPMTSPVGNIFFFDRNPILDILKKAGLRTKTSSNQ